MNIDYNAVANMKHKVFIAIPQHELGRYTAFENHLDRIIVPPSTIKQRLCGIYIANSQNALARIFLATDFEWFWLLNDDQVYPHDTLLRLLAHNKQGIITPLCLEKEEPHYPLIYGKSQNGLRTRITLQRNHRGLMRIPDGACGGGGILIHRRVFEAIPEPWWTVTTVKSESGHYEQSSEDFDFCDRAAKAGVKLYCDFDLTIVHLALYGVRPVRDEVTGEWSTALLREEEQILIPAAKSQSNLIQAPSFEDITLCRSLNP